VRAVEIGADRILRTTEREPGRPGEGEIRVEVGHAGICGSDLHNLQMPDYAPAGTVLGHEFSGIVAELGTGVGRLRPGDRVAVLPFDFCGVCARCVSGSPQTCVQIRTTKIGGAFRQGAFAESVIVPAASAYVLPDSVGDAEGALVEPIAVGIHGVAAAESSPEEPVAVVGGGPVGVMVTLALQARGFSRIVGVEPNRFRRDRLAGLGIAVTAPDDGPEAAREALAGAVPNVVFDCSGHPTGPSTALELLEPLGRLVVLGSTVRPAPFDFYRLVRDEIRVRGAVCYTREEFKEAIEHLAAGRIPSGDLITDIRDLDRAQESFEELIGNGTTQMKILLTP